MARSLSNFTFQQFGIMFMEGYQSYKLDIPKLNYQIS